MLFFTSFIIHNNENKKNEPTVLLDSKCSDACEYLLKKVDKFGIEGNKYRTNLKAQKFILKNRLVVNSTDVILFSYELDNQKLFFTKLQFDLKGQLKTIKYFYYGTYSSLLLDYSTIREKIKTRIGPPSKTTGLKGEMETVWVIDNNKFLLTFEKELVTRNGVISLLVTNILKDQNISHSTSVPPRSKAKPSTKINPAKPELVEGTFRTVTEKTSVRSFGRDGASVLFRIDINDTLMILKSEYNYYWTKIRYKNQKGWIKTSLLK